jgi:hypothetical protein
MIRINLAECGSLDVYGLTAQTTQKTTLYRVSLKQRSKMLAVASGCFGWWAASSLTNSETGATLPYV